MSTTSLKKPTQSQLDGGLLCACAQKFGHKISIEIVKSLLAQNADPHLSFGGSHSGKSAFDYACTLGAVSVYKSMLEANSGEEKTTPKNDGNAVVATVSIPSNAESKDTHYSTLRAHIGSNEVKTTIPVPNVPYYAKVAAVIASEMVDDWMPDLIDTVNNDSSLSEDSLAQADSDSTPEVWISDSEEETSDFTNRSPDS
jgi:hypothetical protein